MDEIFVADPIDRTVRFFQSTPDGYVASDALRCAGIHADDLARRIRWP